MTAAPKSDDAYCLVLDRRQLCFLFARIYDGSGSTHVVADELAALILGRALPRPPYTTSGRSVLRSRAAALVEREFSTLQRVLKETSRLHDEHPGIRSAATAACDEFARWPARDAS